MNQIKVRILYGLLGVLAVFCLALSGQFGATNPADDDWVAGVLALDASYFTSATNGSDPSWIEGSGSSPSTPTIRNGSIR